MKNCFKGKTFKYVILANLDEF